MVERLLRDEDMSPSALQDMETVLWRAINHYQLYASYPLDYQRFNERLYALFGMAVPEDRDHERQLLSSMTDRELSNRYHGLVARYHPDLHPDQRELGQRVLPLLTEAYARLLRRRSQLRISSFSSARAAEEEMKGRATPARHGAGLQPGHPVWPRLRVVVQGDGRPRKVAAAVGTVGELVTYLTRRGHLYEPSEPDQATMVYVNGVPHPFEPAEPSPLRPTDTIIVQRQRWTDANGGASDVTNGSGSQGPNSSGGGSGTARSAFAVVAIVAVWFWPAFASVWPTVELPPGVAVLLALAGLELGIGVWLFAKGAGRRAVPRTVRQRALDVFLTSPVTVPAGLRLLTVPLAKGVPSADDLLVIAADDVRPRSPAGWKKIGAWLIILAGAGLLSAMLLAAHLPDLPSALPGGLSDGWQAPATNALVWGQAAGLFTDFIDLWLPRGA